MRPQGQQRVAEPRREEENAFQFLVFTVTFQCANTLPLARAFFQPFWKIYCSVFKSYAIKFWNKLHSPALLTDVQEEDAPRARSNGSMASSEDIPFKEGGNTIAAMVTR